MKNKKYIVIIAVVIITLVVGVGAYFILQSRDDSRESTTPGTANQQPAQITDDQSPTNDTDQTQQANDPRQDQVDNSGAAATISITSAMQADTIVQIRTSISPISSGTCSLTISQNGENYTETVETQSLPQFATCKGFDVPARSLPSGKWTIEITFTDAQGKTNLATKEINVSY